MILVQFLFLPDVSKSLAQSLFVTSRIRDITSEEGGSSSSGDVSIATSLQTSLLYIAVAFVIFTDYFLVLISINIVLKKTPLPDSKTIDRPADQQDQYNMFVHASPIDNNEPAYLEPISNVHYEEIENYAVAFDYL